MLVDFSEGVVVKVFPQARFFVVVQHHLEFLHGSQQGQVGGRVNDDFSTGRLVFRPEVDAEPGIFPSTTPVALSGNVGKLGTGVFRQRLFRGRRPASMLRVELWRTFTPGCTLQLISPGSAGTWGADFSGAAGWGAGIGGCGTEAAGAGTAGTAGAWWRASLAALLAFPHDVGFRLVCLLHLFVVVAAHFSPHPFCTGCRCTSARCPRSGPE